MNSCQEKIQPSPRNCQGSFLHWHALSLEARSDSEEQWMSCSKSRHEEWPLFRQFEKALFGSLDLLMTGYYYIYRQTLHGEPCELLNYEFSMECHLNTSQKILNIHREVFLHWQLGMHSIYMGKHSIASSL